MNTHTTSVPKVSVIIPVYNVEKYVDKCLHSIVNQTFSDIEIIVINDGSTDGSGVKCLEWATRDERIIYVSKKNEGAGPARNLGIQMASAEFVAFCDPDDWYNERYIELMLKEQRKTDADVVVCGYHKYDEELGKVASTFISEPISNYPRRWAHFLTPAVWCKVFRKAVFIENSISMPTCYGQDSAIHNFIMAKATSISVLDYPLYYYRFNRQESAMANYVRHMADTVNFLKYGWDLFIRDGIFEEHKTELLLSAVSHINLWCQRVNSNTAYTKKWLADCSSAISAYFGDTAKILDMSICIIGSYSLYNAVIPKEFADRKIVSEHCFSGLISYMSAGGIASPACINAFRQTALERDFQKTLRNSVTNKEFDRIIIDFLDERFDIAETEWGYYTKSDAFLECEIPFDYSTLNRWDPDTIKLWKEKCLEFIDVITERYLPQQIILVKNYLVERYGTYRDQKEFENTYETKKVNVLLNDCYSFFEAHIPGIQVIEIDDTVLRYVSSYFKHGSEQWHYNNGYYMELRSRISQLLLCTAIEST